jgi:hypothetical protein
MPKPAGGHAAKCLSKQTMVSPLALAELSPERFEFRMPVFHEQ